MPNIKRGMMGAAGASSGGPELFTWGSNQYGQLGLGDTTSRSSPTQIGALKTWANITFGNSNAFAVQTDGTLWVWGWGQSGVLGDGTSVSKSSPVQVGSLTNWVSVNGKNAAGGVKTDGTLWMWGLGSTGAIGDGTSVSKSSPVQVGALTTWASNTSTTQGSTHAVTTDGKLFSWGYGAYGALGTGTGANYSSPIQVGALTNWAEAHGAYYASIARKTDGTVWGWGYGAYNLLGTGVATVNSPVQIGSATNWATVSATHMTGLGVQTDGTLWGWGRNGYGEIGDGTTSTRAEPVQVGSLTNWAAVAQCGGPGQGHSIARKTDGTLWGWGRNDAGQIGDGTTVGKSSPVQIGSLTTWSDTTPGRSMYTQASAGILEP